MKEAPTGKVDSTPANRPKKFYRLVLGAIPLLTIAVSIVAVFPAYLPFLKRTELQIQIVSAERQAASSAIPDFTAEYTYQSRPVKNLWQLVLNVVNVGNQTIVFSGTNSNVINESVTFSFGEGVKILSVDPRQEVADIKLSFDNESIIKFTGLQWRPGESFSFQGYAETSDDLDPNWFLSIDAERRIVDGELTLRDLRTPATPPSPFLFDRYFPDWGKPLRAGFYITLIFVIFQNIKSMELPELFSAISEKRRRIKWQEEHLESALEFLKPQVAGPTYKMLTEEGSYSVYATHDTPPNESLIDEYSTVHSQSSMQYSEYIKNPALFEEAKPKIYYTTKSPLHDWDAFWSAFNGPPPERGGWLSRTPERGFLYHWSDFFVGGLTAFTAAFALLVFLAL